MQADVGIILKDYCIHFEVIDFETIKCGYE